MARECEVCGKGASVGNQITKRGKAKYLGGVGTKLTGITKRRFKPNLQTVHITDKHGTNKSLRVCTQCIRSGAITKTVRSAPFRLPKEAVRVKDGASKERTAKEGVAKRVAVKEVKAKVKSK